MSAQGSSPDELLRLLQLDERAFEAWSKRSDWTGEGAQEDAGGGAGDPWGGLGGARAATSAATPPADLSPPAPPAVGFPGLPIVATPLPEDELFMVDRWKEAGTAAGLGSWEWELQGDRFTLDAGGHAQLGLEAGEADGDRRSFEERVHPVDRALLRRAWRDHLAQLVPRYEAQYRVRGAQGEWAWVLERGRVVARDEMGHPTRMAGVQVRLDSDQPGSSPRARDLFVASLSHEIRTPLAAILGFGELLSSAGLAEGERERAVSTIQENGEHLMQLLNDLLDLSRIEAGRLEVEQVRCSPFDVVEQVCDLLAPRAAARQLMFESRVEGKLPETMLSDPTRLRQILLNLVGNAIRYTDVGSVRVESRLRGDDRGPARLEISVVDTGIGLDPGEIDALFEPFCGLGPRQGDAPTERRDGGTGLGLSISRQLARLLGGDIRVQSTRGEGSRFTLVLPVGDLSGVPLVDAVEATRALQRRRRARQEHARAERGLAGRYLVAEDSLPNQMLLEQILLRSGARVELVGNGQEAVQAAQRALHEGDPFAAVVMDMHMPVMDGYLATETLRGQGYRGHILALTASARSSDRALCLAAGCDAFFAKPLDRAGLLEHLQAVEASLEAVAG